MTRCAPQELQYRQYQVVGRKIPTESDPTPPMYRLKVFAQDEVFAKSRFWYYMNRLRKVKKSVGEVLRVIEIKEKSPNQVKNYGIWIRYDSRSGTHNMYKEARGTSLNGAIKEIYEEMGSRHRARHSVVQIVKTDIIPAAECRRDNTTQFHDSKIAFPLKHRLPRSNKKSHKSTFKAHRPQTWG